MSRAGKTMSLAKIMKGRRFLVVSSDNNGGSRFTEHGADGRPVLDVGRELVPVQPNPSHGGGRDR